MAGPLPRRRRRPEDVGPAHSGRRDRTDPAGRLRRRGGSASARTTGASGPSRRSTWTSRRGEFFGFLGPNGAGKTTMIHMLTTLLRPSRGSAVVAGHDVVDEPLDVRKHVGLVFQETTLDPELTAEENLSPLQAGSTASRAPICTAASTRCSTLFGLQRAPPRPRAHLLRRHAPPGRPRPRHPAPARGPVPRRAYARARPGATASASGASSSSSRARKG